jgi:hypothetical protein
MIQNEYISINYSLMTEYEKCFVWSIFIYKYLLSLYINSFLGFIYQILLLFSKSVKDII